MQVADEHLSERANPLMLWCFEIDTDTDTDADTGTISDETDNHVELSKQARQVEGGRSYSSFPSPNLLKRDLHSAADTKFDVHFRLMSSPGFKLGETNVPAA